MSGTFCHLYVGSLIQRVTIHRSICVCLDFADEALPPQPIFPVYETRKKF